jgi:MFS family permease
MEIGRRGSFAVAAAVVALSLWTSTAPTITYPLYAAEWHLTTTVTTALFAVYPAALAVVLIAAGNLADAIGRRAAILWGLAAALVGIVLFAVAPSIEWAFLGRAFTGIGVGLSVGPATAAMIEFSAPGRERMAAAGATIATSAGMAVSTALGGALIEYAPFPTHLNFWVLAAFIAALGVASYFLPRDRSRQAWRFAFPSVPRGLGAVFAAGAVGVALSTAIGAVISALGAQIAKQLIGSDNALVQGSAFVLFAVVSAVVALIVRSVAARPNLILGGAITAAGVLVLLGSSLTHSLPIFLTSMIVLGVGWSFLFTGGLGIIGPRVPQERRAATLSAVYLIAYAVQAGGALGLGALATAHGLGWAVNFGTITLAVLAIGCTILALTTRSPKHQPSNPDPVEVVVVESA